MTMHQRSNTRERVALCALCAVLTPFATAQSWSLLWHSDLLNDDIPLPASSSATTSAGTSLFVHGGIASPGSYQTRYGSGSAVYPQISIPVASEAFAFDYVGRSWVKQQSSYGPGPFADHCMCYHKASQSVFMFGGWNWGRASPTSSVRAFDRNELWRASLTFGPGVSEGRGAITGWSWSYLGNGAASAAANGGRTNRWPAARRSHVCACHPDRMMIFGGYTVDTVSSIRMLYNDAWEFVPFKARTPVVDTSAPGGISYVTAWQGAWRRIGIHSNGRPGNPPMPSPRLGASGSIVLIPWYFGYRATGMTGQGTTEWTNSYALLDVLLIAGGQDDRGDLDIMTDGITAPDTTWYLFLDTAPDVPPEETMPIALLPVTYLPADMPGRFASAGLPMYAVPSRNGSWYTMLFEPSSQSADDGSLNRWYGTMVTAGGQQLLWFGGQSLLDPTSEAGSSVGVLSSMTMSMPVEDVGDQVDAAWLRSTGISPNARPGTQYNPYSLGWRVARIDTGGSFDVDNGDGGTKTVRFGPTTGAALVAVNQSDPIVVSQNDAGGGALRNGGGSGLILAYGGWTLDPGTGVALPSNDVWLLDLTAGPGKGSAFDGFLPVRELEVGDMRRTLTVDPRIPTSVSVSIFLGFCLAFTFLMLCCVQESVAVNTLIVLERSCIGSVLARGLQLAALFSCLSPDSAIMTAINRRNMTPAQLDEAARAEAEEMRRGVTDENLNKLPTFLFTTVAAALAAGGAAGGGAEAPGAGAAGDSSTASVVRFPPAIVPAPAAGTGTGTAAGTDVSSSAGGQATTSEQGTAASTSSVSVGSTEANSNGNTAQVDVKAGGPAPTAAAGTGTGPAASGFFAVFMRARGLSAGASVSADIAGTSCPICLTDYEEKNPLRRLPCGHFFHKDCVDTWLKFNSKLCPMCKHSVLHEVAIPVPLPPPGMTGPAAGAGAAGAAIDPQGQGMAGLFAARAGALFRRGQASR